jgi:hypothetical protein
MTTNLNLQSSKIDGKPGRTGISAICCLGILALAQQALMAAALKPAIASATFNVPANQIAIAGKHFTPESGAPSVELNGGLLTVVSWSDTSIVADTPPGLVAASYALLVNNGLFGAFVASLDPRFGNNTTMAVAGIGATCTIGQVMLTAGVVANGIPATGQLLPITGNTPLFSLLGNIYGGDGINTFGVPDLRGVAPNGLTYTICNQGTFPQKN